MPPPRTIDRYEVLDRLGRGGMGIVYRARDPRLGRTVAIKVLVNDDEEFRRRFLQEAQLAATLHHRNIVTVFDYGEQESGPFIVMEYIEGATLADYLQSGSVLAIDRKLELLLDLSTAIDYAHNHGIVHRDIKPANLMIDKDGTLKILDFGVARVNESQLTQIGALIGTPSYMSPEQIEGKPTDRRTDVFAVGVTAYELLSSHKAFPDPSSAIRAVLLEDPTPLRNVCPDLDPDIDRIVTTAIRKDPSSRYASLAIMAADLKRALERQRSLRGQIRPDDEMTRPVPTMARTQSRSSESPVDRALERARNAFVKGRYESAIASAAEVLESEPDNPEALELTRLALGAFERNRASAQRAHDSGTGPARQQNVASSKPAPGRRQTTLIAAAVAAVLLVVAVIVGVRWMRSSRAKIERAVPQSVVPAPPSQQTTAPPPLQQQPVAPAKQPAVADKPVEKKPPPARGGLGDDTKVPQQKVVPPPLTGWQALQSACDRGDADKCLDLGEAYQTGNGPEKDVVRAATAFQRACDGRNAHACNQLGIAYRNGVGVPLDLARAMTLYQRACEGNYGAGCSNLGAFYARGLSVTKDEARATSLAQRACEMGHGPGCDNAGRGYELGLGVARDGVRAVSLYQRGCTAGDSASCTSLGWAYYRGAGIDRDEVRAVTLFRRACDEGNAPGCNDLGFAMEQGRGTARDEKRAIELFQQACDKNNPLGCMNLARSYQRGSAVPKDDARALTFFQRACDAGNTQSCINVGNLYATGQGAAKDDVRAVGQYQRACDAGAADGCTRAANMYEQGRGVSKDSARATALSVRGRELAAQNPNESTSQFTLSLPSNSGNNNNGQPVTPTGRDTKPQAGSSTAMSTAGPVSPPAKLKEVKPDYPTAALYARVQGDVIVEATIGTDGAVTKTRVLQSIPLLDAAAEDAVKQWRYAPTAVNGKAVVVTMPVTVKFTLTTAPPESSAPGRGR